MTTADGLQWETVTYSDDREPVFIEVIPTDGHEEGPDCWCSPDLMMDCSECGLEDEECWKCGGRGLVEYGRFAGEVPIAVHHDERLP